MIEAILISMAVQNGKLDIEVKGGRVVLIAKVLGMKIPLSSFDPSMIMTPAPPADPEPEVKRPALTLVKSDA